MSESVEYLKGKIKRLEADRDVLLAVVREFRELVREGGVPRYTVLPGAALNDLIEAGVDPVLQSFEVEEKSRTPSPTPG